MWTTYHCPATLDEALTLLDDHQEKARIIAGGTDILIELERGQRHGVDALIDITRIPSLDDIIQDDDGWITLGPLVSQNHVVGSDLVVQHALPLAQAAWSEAAPQIRNRATVAGNIITASPANDTIPPLMTLGAVITLQSANATRHVPIDAFYTGFRQTVMQPNEMVTAIRFPAMEAHEKGVFIKLGLRRAQAISVVNIAVILSMEDDRIEEARIAYGSIGPRVIRADAVEAVLDGKPLDESTIRQAVDQAAEVGTPIDDVRGTARYRKTMTKRLLRQALEALHRGEKAFPDDPPMLWGDNQGRVTSGLPQSSTHKPDTPIETTINGQVYTIHGANYKTLLHMLRDDAGLIGTKEGCSEGECGACTVFLDDVAVMACMVAAPRAHQAEIVTIEGLAANGDLHPVQRGFVRAGAVQCGYCTPGFIMAGAKLLEEKPSPTRKAIEYSIAGNLCRCTGYYKIIDAIQDGGQNVT